MVDPHQPLLSAIARDGSFTPTRSARAPPVATLLPPETGGASAGDEPCHEGHPQGRQTRPRFRETWLENVSQRDPRFVASFDLLPRTCVRFRWPPWRKTRAAAVVHSLGPPHTPSREGERVTPRPRYLRSTRSPPKGCALALQPAVTSGEKSREPAPFRSSRVPRP